MAENKSTREFISGLYVNKPHIGAPDFVMANGSIDYKKFVEFYKNADLSETGGKIYFDVLRSKDGEKYVCYLSTYKPKGTRGENDLANATQERKFNQNNNEDDLPF